MNKLDELHITAHESAKRRRALDRVLTRVYAEGSPGSGSVPFEKCLAACSPELQAEYRDARAAVNEAEAANRKAYSRPFKV